MWLVLRDGVAGAGVPHGAGPRGQVEPDSRPSLQVQDELFGIVRDQREIVMQEHAAPIRLPGEW